MKTVCLVSLKFSPGHFSHLLAYQELFRDLGYRVICFLDEGYRSFCQDWSSMECVYRQEQALPAELVLIYNLSAKDSKFLARAKAKNPRTKTIFVYHEPYRGFRETFDSLRKRERSLKHFIGICGRHLFSKSVLRRVDMVLLPSKSAMDEYRGHDQRYNGRYVLFPLIFTDELTPELAATPKVFFSFISTALLSKGIKEYLDSVLYIAERDPNARFQIATKSDISGLLAEEHKKLVVEKRLVIQQGRPLSNAEINQAYASSNCTWLAYNKSTQSGVLCKSFMFGAPGMATNIGAFPDEIDGNNGLILSSNKDSEEIYQAFELLKNDNVSFSASARRSYLENFDYKNHLADMRAIMGQIDA